MDCLRSIGIETSSETIPCTSRELQRKWRYGHDEP
jgi:hypothetical protein